MGTDGNAVDAAVETPLDVDAVTVVAIDVVAVVVTVVMLRVQEDMTQQVSINPDKSQAAKIIATSVHSTLFTGHRMVKPLISLG